MSPFYDYSDWIPPAEHQHSKALVTPMIENFLAGSAALFGDPVTIAIFVFGVIGGMLFGAIPGGQHADTGSDPAALHRRADSRAGA